MTPPSANPQHSNMMEENHFQVPEGSKYLLCQRTANLLETAAAGIQKPVYPISTLFVYLSAMLTFAMAIMVLVDVVLRTAFSRPITGVIELETFMLAILSFFSMAYTMRKGGHVAVDIFTDKFPLNLKLFLDSLFPIFGMFLFGIISREYGFKVQEALEISEASPSMGWPLSIFYAVTSIGCALMVLVLLINYLTNQADLLKKSTRAWWLTFLVLLVAVGVLVSPWLLTLLSVEFDPSLFGILMLGVMMLLLFLGLPVGFTMGLVGILGTWYLTDLETSLGIVRISVYEAVANYFLCAVPFFVLMGFLCLKSGISKSLYNTAYKWFGQLPGGMAIATIFGCGGFAAICGDSMATAATMGSVSLPEMKKYKYADSLATGSVAAGGTLGILIPPSLGFIFYALITEESVGKLFAAGVIPGIMLVIGFSIMIYLRCRINPNLGPKAPATSLLEKIISIKNVWAIVILFILVIGGIYMGFFTPTEGGGIGVMGAFVIALTSKEFNRKEFMEALMTTTQITGMVAGIIIGVTVLGYFVTLTGIPEMMANFISTLDVSRYVLFVLILLLYLVLGMVMNIIPMIMLTLPILYPTVLALGFNPIWFGVIMVIMMEMGQISPPVGINVFVISGVAKDVSIGKIFRGIFPFLLVEAIVIVILTIFPDIVMILPDAMDVLPEIAD